MKLRIFLTIWWAMCIVVNMAIGGVVNVVLAIFSGLMFFRSFHKLLNALLKIQ